MKVAWRKAGGGRVWHPPECMVVRNRPENYHVGELSALNGTYEPCQCSKSPVQKNWESKERLTMTKRWPRESLVRDKAKPMELCNLPCSDGTICGRMKSHFGGHKPTADQEELEKYGLLMISSQGERRPTRNDPTGGST